MLLRGGVTALIFIADGADAVSSFVKRSKPPGPSSGRSTTRHDVHVVALHVVLERSAVESAGWKFGRNDTSGVNSDRVTVSELVRRRAR